MKLKLVVAAVALSRQEAWSLTEVSWAQNAESFLRGLKKEEGILLMGVSREEFATGARSDVKKLCLVGH
jgi:hypothetical protein